LDKRFDAVGFDLFLRVDAQLFADLDFDRQPMGIPTRLPLAAVTAHRAITGEQIFDRSGETMSRMRHSVSGRRPFVENKRRRIGASSQRFFVDAPLFPKLADGQFTLRKSLGLVDGGKHRGKVGLRMEAATR